MADISITRGAISYQVRGTNRVRNQFRAIAAFYPRKVDKVARRDMQRIRRILKAKPYPPKRTGQTYRRTGLLSNKWAVKRDRPGVWSIVNNAARGGKKYPGYVVGDKQAWMHKNRWWIASKEIEKEMPEFTRNLSQELDRDLA